METSLITTDVLVLPFFGQGHLFPCVELCKKLSSSLSHHCTPILIIPSHLSSSIPSNLHLTHPSIHLLQIPSSSTTTTTTPTPPPPSHHHFAHPQLGLGIQTFLSERYKNGARPRCVVMDVMMSWSKDIFKTGNIPIITFFTSGACSTAMEYAAWKAAAADITPGETRMLSGLPDTVALSYSDLLRRDQGHHRSGGGRGRSPPMQGRRGGRMDFSPPGPGQLPRWLEEAEASTALLINTCDDLEGPFLTYLADQIGKPVLGVGPLLPESYWGAAAEVHDRDSRPDRHSNRTEDEVIQWLDSKPARSVIYVSFGSEVGPTLGEYDQLADALRESKIPFIWVIQPGAGKPGQPNKLFGGPSRREEEGYYPKGLEQEVADRGLIIKGWAPQLLILSHTSTGGFLSHCGWNSTVEALGRGIPILAWPIRGDQYYNAKLVVDHLGVGCQVSGGDEMVKKGDIMGGIDKLMEDREIQGRVMVLKGVFEGGYPSSSEASLKTLIELVSK